MAYYTQNLCPNPSFQLGLEGYDSLLNADLFLDTSRFLFGTQSCRIVTPGLFAGEGCSTAAGLIQSASTCSVSIYILGEGSVSVSANVSPGPAIAGTFPVMLTNEWTRVIINDIPCSPGEQLYLTVYTTSKQRCTMWISGIQIEPSSPAHAYCDGDQVGCFWFNGSFGGVAVQEFQFPASATGIATATGNIVPALLLNEILHATVIPGVSHSLGNLIFANQVNPVAAFTDFGIFELTDPDPAQTYVSWNNAGSNSGTGSTYTRPFATFYAPLDYIVSDGSFLWNRAAFMSAGFQFSSVAHGGSQSITNVQTELLPMNTAFSAPSPSTYHLPRRIHSIVIPDRLNFCSNPSFETSLAGWTALGEGVLSLDAAKTAGNIIEFDDVQYTAGVQSMKVTVNATGDGAEISIADLIIGETYIISAYVQAGQGMENILMTCSGGAGGADQQGIPYGIEGEYGEVIYGGVSGDEDLALSTWFRPNFTFLADASTVTLAITGNTASDVSLPTEFWVDAVLIELGEDLLFYFDGNFGTNFSWETTQNLSRSYYYRQQAVRTQAVINTLAQHIPLGISFDSPKYSTPYTQT
jgi:hypothetical protein